MLTSYIRVRAVVWAYGRGQPDTQTRVTTIHFASSTTHAKCKKCGVTWQIRWKFIRPLAPERRSRRHCQCHTPWGALWEKYDVIHKPEVHNVFHCRQKRTEPQPRKTCVENLVKFEYEVFKIRQQTHTYTHRQTDRQTDRQTYRHTHHNTSHPYLGNEIRMK